MALKKDYSYGSVSGNYWKIIGNHSNTMYSATVVRIALYENQEARTRDEAGYIKVLPISIPGPDHTRATAYAELKKRPEFEGAEDIWD